MAQLTNNVSVFKVPNVSEFGANQDGISGLILLTPIAAWSALVADTPYKWRSLRDAEAAGLTFCDGSELTDLAYIHVREFFHFNPSRTLWVIISESDTETFSTALGTGPTTLDKTLLKAASGDIRQLAIARVTDRGTQVAGTGIVAEVAAAIPVAQALIDDEFEPNKRPWTSSSMGTAGPVRSRPRPIFAPIRSGMSES